MMKKKDGKVNRNNLSRNIFIFAMIIIPTIHFLVFYLYVNFNSFFMGFQLTNRKGEITWTLENFRRFFAEFNENSLSVANQDTSVVYAIVNTLKTFLLNLLLFPIGFLVSYFLYKKVPGWKTYRVAFFLPVIIPSMVLTYSFTTMLGTRGFIAEIVQRMNGLERVPDILANNDYANKAVFAFIVWMGIPGNLLLWSGALARVPEEVVESARLDGVNWVQEAVHIIIPIIWPTFAIQFLMLFIGLFGASGPVFLLTGGGSGTNTLSNWMFQRVYNSSETSIEHNYMSAVGLLITAITLPLCLGIRFVISKFFKGVEY